jgi:NADPH:quinone reductase-like Zn-dependent oxidoreductase
LGAPGLVFSTTHTDRHFDEIVEFIAPQGRLCLIDDPELFDFRKLKRKSVSLHWELMFTRSLFDTPDVARQHELLVEVAAMIDRGQIRTTLAEHFGKIGAENLKRAHALIESGQSRGKIVLEGF